MSLGTTKKGIVERLRKFADAIENGNRCIRDSEMKPLGPFVSEYHGRFNGKDIVPGMGIIVPVVYAPSLEAQQDYFERELRRVLGWQKGTYDWECSRMNVAECLYFEASLPKALGGDYIVVRLYTEAGEPVEWSVYCGNLNTIAEGPTLEDAVVTIRDRLRDSLRSLGTPHSNKE